MNAIMGWTTVAFASMTLFGAVYLIGDELRWRLFRRWQPATPRALEGMSVADVLFMIGFAVPVLLGGWSAWANL